MKRRENHCCSPLTNRLSSGLRSHWLRFPTDFILWGTMEIVGLLWSTPLHSSNHLVVMWFFPTNTKGNESYTPLRNRTHLDDSKNFTGQCRVRLSQRNFGLPTGLTGASITERLGGDILDRNQHLDPIYDELPSRPQAFDTNYPRHSRPFHVVVA